MAFVFNLKSVLRVREIREEAALQRLRAVLAQFAAARAEIQMLDDSVQSNRKDMCAASLSGMSGAELHFQSAGESAQSERRKFLVGRLQELERAQQAQRALYVQARQQREIVSNLRERQLLAYNLEESRRTQREIDEMFLIRLAAAGDRRRTVRIRGLTAL